MSDLADRYDRAYRQYSDVEDEVFEYAEALFGGHFASAGIDSTDWAGTSLEIGGAGHELKATQEHAERAYADHGFDAICIHYENGDRERRYPMATIRRQHEGALYWSLTDRIGEDHCP